MLKNYINTQITGKIKKIGIKRFSKKWAKEANELTDILDDSWWEICLGFIPVAGDAFDLANTPIKIRKALKKADKLQAQIDTILQIQGKPAKELLKHGKFRRLIENDPIADKTFAELDKLSSGSGPNAKKAKTLLKVIQNAHRLGEKI